MDVVRAVADRLIYLKGYPAYKTSKRGCRHFIFRGEGDAFYDLQFDPAKGEVSDLGMIAGIAAFAEHFEKNSLGHQPAAREIGPYAEIPQEVLAAITRMGTAPQDVYKRLAGDPAMWFPVMDAGWFVRHAAAFGWHSIHVADSRVDCAGVWDEARVRTEIAGTMLRGAAREAGAVPPETLGALEGIERKYVDTLATLKGGGHVALLWDNGVEGSCFAMLGGVIGYVRTRNRRLESVAPQPRGRGRDAILDGIVKRTEPLLSPMPPELAAPLASKAKLLGDPKEVYRALEAGELRLGGGPTTDSAWWIKSDGRGAFRQRSGGQERPIEAARVREIVLEGRYGWVE